MLFLGIDLGTQGVRGLVVDENGSVVSQGGRHFPVLNMSNTEKHSEQSADIWISTLVDVLKQCVGGLAEKGYKPDDIGGIGIDGTSGTILPLDSDNKPLTNALMYNDSRSENETKQVQKAGKSLSEKLGYQFKSSFSLPKILWIKVNMPGIYDKTRVFLHQADYAAGFLSGNYNASDYSNALKTGYDLIENKWPDFIEEELGVSTDKLPRVDKPGTVVGSITKEIADLTGLSTKTKVCVGATDGIASALASGIRKPGDYNTTIGTTLVIKGLAKTITRDPQGRIYSHRHPDGYWIPGAASNTGGICLNHYFKDRDFAEFDKRVNLSEPSGLICYPLIGKGERFPFLNGNAEGFIEGDIKDEVQHYTSLMEGVGFIERLSYEIMEEQGCDRVNAVYTAGGAAKSDVWLQIRANILNRKILVPEVVEAAMGAAILAASTIKFKGDSEAVDSMVVIEKEFLPDSSVSAKYNSMYKRFKDACIRRGLMNQN